jgi:hypothetical protein
MHISNLIIVTIGNAGKTDAKAVSPLFARSQMHQMHRNKGSSLSAETALAKAHRSEPGSFGLTHLVEAEIALRTNHHHRVLA